MEGYILGGRNIAEHLFKKRLKNIYGDSELKNFEKLYRDNFIQKEDFHRISQLGANCVRLPFNYRILENKPFKYEEDCFLYLDRAISWAKSYKIKIILDLHAAQGGQNCDWHSDSWGKAYLWESTNLRKRVNKLWETIAKRYKGEETIYGYDLLNEPVIEKSKLGILKELYREIIKTIRDIDKEKFIFLEGNIWAQEIEFLQDILGEKIAISIHTYQPLNFTFNFINQYRYPGKIDGKFWDKSQIFRYLDKYYSFSKRKKVEIFVGEFGVNYRGNAWGEVDYLRDILEVFEEFSFSYTYWTYKSIPLGVFPDGIYQYLYNPKYVRREGPIFGWENYLSCWKKEKGEIVNFWRTESYVINKDISSLLKEFFLKP
ncbi:MAG: glycoside hydrolase family 5 protein [Candidatus Omnitrophica bacterium]|nr:glycoside hydrolase family 5 protein [Candidatus Omnitrophota bacterium]